MQGNIWKKMYKRKRFSLRFYDLFCRRLCYWIKCHKYFTQWTDQRDLLTAFVYNCTSCQLNWIENFFIGWLDSDFFLDPSKMILHKSNLHKAQMSCCVNCRCIRSLWCLLIDTFGTKIIAKMFEVFTDFAVKLFFKPLNN